MEKAMSLRGSVGSNQVGYPLVFKHGLLEKKTSNPMTFPPIAAHV